MGIQPSTTRKSALTISMSRPCWRSCASVASEVSATVTSTCTRPASSTRSAWDEKRWAAPIAAAFREVMPSARASAIRARSRDTIFAESGLVARSVFLAAALLAWPNGPRPPTARKPCAPASGAATASRATARSVARPALRLTRARTACRGAGRSAVIAGGWCSAPSTRFPKAAVAVVRHGIIDGGREVSFLSWGTTPACSEQGRPAGRRQQHPVGHEFVEVPYHVERPHVRHDPPYPSGRHPSHPRCMEIRPECLAPPPATSRSTATASPRSAPPPPPETRSDSATASPGDGDCVDVHAVVPVIGQVP